MSYGDNLSRLRTKRGLTMDDLEKLSGVYKQRISEYEKGLRTPTLAAAVAIAGALGVTVDEMVKGDDV